ncbi:MAG: phosphotransferase family protein [Mycolicibacterium aromaticivorans]|nr:phosphotransferase family protein [Mycolicibacterium aromaticivorans]
MTGDLLDDLQARLAPQGISGLRPLAGGASSLTFVADLADRRVVVKVAPPGHAPIAHRDVLRQARILRALRGTEVPVPQHTLGVLHRLSPAELDLTGEPVIAPDAEVDKWCRTLETVDPALSPGWQQVANALRVATPPPIAPAIVHGDFRLGNLLADQQGITAVIDWEIWSVGDPRVDVGWFLINSDPDTYQRATPYRGTTPPVHELVAEYRDALGRDAPRLEWFQALACFKSTATWSLIVKHNRRRPAPDPELEAMAASLPGLLARAADHLG